VEVESVEIQNDPEVIASIIHLMEIDVLEDGQTVGKFPDQMAMFERDLFDRTSEVLISLGGVLNREAGGFLFPSSVDIDHFIETLLDQDPVISDELKKQEFFTETEECEKSAQERSHHNL